MTLVKRCLPETTHSGQQTNRSQPRCTQSRGRYYNVPGYLKRWVYKQHVLLREWDILKALYPKVAHMARRSRKKIYKMAIQCHRDNRRMFDLVVGAK